MPENYMSLIEPKAAERFVDKEFENAPIRPIPQCFFKQFPVYIIHIDKYILVYIELDKKIVKICLYNPDVCRYNRNRNFGTNRRNIP